MPTIPGRVPEEARALARRRLDSVTRRSPVARSTVPVVERLAEDLRSRLPTTVRDGRVVMSRAAAAGLAVVAVAACLLAGSYLWRARTVEAVVPAAPTVSAPAGTATPPAAGAAVPSATPSGQVVVDVAGRVRRPGVVSLPPGSRVVDAIDAAGGVRGDVDLSSLNLARILNDGEQVLVGAAPSAPPVQGGGPSAGGDPGVVDLNSATLEQLDSLPGVGPVLAQRILDWRAAHGRFTTIDELREVSGIGESRFADLAPHVRV